MWHQVFLSTTETAAELAAAILTECGALSVSFEDEGDQPLFEPKPGKTPIWQRTRVTALFEPAIDLDTVRDSLQAAIGKAAFSNWHVEALADQVWERAWLEHFQPMSFGLRLWVVPTGFEAPESADAVCVNLDPGLAFGTGTHPTTALCLRWLDGHELDRATVIDYGCGSGILAVAAVLLGAARATAIDIDPQALLATADNAEKNGVSGLIRCCHPDELAPAMVDVLLANILATPLKELAPDLANLVRPGGHIVLSGILQDQAEDVLAAYRPYFVMDPPAFLEDWTRLSGTRIED